MSQYQSQVFIVVVKKYLFESYSCIYSILCTSTLYIQYIYIVVIYQVHFLFCVCSSLNVIYMSWSVCMYVCLCSSCVCGLLVSRYICTAGNPTAIPAGRLTPTNSPLRQSGRRTPPFMPQLFSAPPMLPPILGSPTKLGQGGQDNPAGDICGNTTNMPLTAPHRAITLPEMTSVSRDLFTGQ